MRRMCSRIRELTDEDQTYQRARELAHDVVKMQKMDSLYVGEAIKELTSAWEFGSWLRKLYHGEKVSVHLHLYERLVAAADAKAEELRRRADRVQTKTQNGRGSNEADEGGHQNGRGMVPSAAGEVRFCAV